MKEITINGVPEGEKRAAGKDNSLKTAPYDHTIQSYLGIHGISAAFPWEIVLSLIYGYSKSAFLIISVSEFIAFRYFDIPTGICIVTDSVVTITSYPLHNLGVDIPIPFSKFQVPSVNTIYLIINSFFHIRR